MEKPESIIEQEQGPKDISDEFMRMGAMEFMEFLRTQRNEPVLSIKIDWAGENKAVRLKAFLEDPDRFKYKQKRTATIRATEEQWKQALNVFASGVKWEKL